MLIHVVADQSEVFAFLGASATHGISEAVKRIDTHGAAVFLAGPDVYKVKRAVKFAFMDFSTLEKRRAACEAEIRANQGDSSYIYLGVVPITRSQGKLHLRGEGEVVEWAVHMRRFDENATLDKLAQRGALTAGLVADLAVVVARAHSRAPIRDFDNGAALKGYIVENGESLGEMAEIFPVERVRRLTEASHAQLLAHGDLMSERRKEGYVRRCHGDLHLRNIALIDGKPVLFDALEFDEAMATGDVLYDLAFLIMDLWERGYEEAANAVLNHYLWEDREPLSIKGLALLPLFLSVRAAIRAKVIGFSLPQLGESQRAQATMEAQRVFLACRAISGGQAAEAHRDRRPFGNGKDDDCGNACPSHRANAGSGAYPQRHRTEVDVRSQRQPASRGGWLHGNCECRGVCENEPQGRARSRGRLRRDRRCRLCRKRGTEGYRTDRTRSLLRICRILARSSSRLADRPRAESEERRVRRRCVLPAPATRCRAQFAVLAPHRGVGCCLVDPRRFALATGRTTMIEPR